MYITSRFLESACTLAASFFLPWIIIYKVDRFLYTISAWPHLTRPSTVTGLNLYARSVRSDRRTRAIVALLSRESVSKSAVSGSQAFRAHHGVSPRLNLAVRRVSPPLARDMRRRNPWQEVAGSSCPPPSPPSSVAHESPAKSPRLVGAAWKVTAVKWHSYTTLRAYDVCRWFIRRSPHVWNLVRVVHVRLSRHGHEHERAARNGAHVNVIGR